VTETQFQRGRAILEIELESEALASILCAALIPETQSVSSERATTSVSTKGSTLIIDVTAGDLTALRAAMNSFMAWVSGSAGAVSSVTGQNP
jgi:tRNA threonylcarbamoyladenosine modification (KEOPS) complex  Pcc1 subunit